VIRDYNRPNTSLNRRAKSRSLLSLLVGLAAITLGVFALVNHSASSSTAPSAGQEEPPLTAGLDPLEVPQESSPEAAPPPPPVQEVFRSEIKAGDSFASLLAAHLSPARILDISRKCRPLFPLKSLKAGRPYALATLEGSFENFTYEIDRDEQLIIRKEGEGFAISRQAIPYETRTEVIEGQIRSSLFEAVSNIGEDIELAISLSDIFGWDIDFIRDIRSGDRFRAVVEKRSREGKTAGYGRILAAEFTNQDSRYRAVLYEKDGNASYYRPDGGSMRRAFLKAPLAFTRISSGYTSKRFHPIQKTWKAHPAIDYAAPEGTPIKTVGDGYISQIGYTRGNGNFIRISHSNGYETMYLHMKGFAKSMRRGKKLNQGQIIGYVGSTGLATGPHLCFRMKRDGEPVNPLKIKTAAGTPIPSSELTAFKSNAAPFLALLESADEGKMMTASAETIPDDSISHTR